MQLFENEKILVTLGDEIILTNERLMYNSPQSQITDILFLSHIAYIGTSSSDKQYYIFIGLLVASVFAFIAISDGYPFLFILSAISVVCGIILWHKSRRNVIRIIAHSDARINIVVSSMTTASVNDFIYEICHAINACQNKTSFHI
jgi:hypothetical protein